MSMDLTDIKRMFPPADFIRGMQYYADKRVENLKTIENDNTTYVSCRVRGSAYYLVFLRMRNGEMYYDSCTCRRFADTGCCKHIVAAMIAYNASPAFRKRSQTDPMAKDLLEHYVRRSEAFLAPMPSTRLLPKICDTYPENEYPILSFRVGQNKLYAVKHIENFLENVRDRETLPLGKQLTLNHSIENFDERSRALIRLLMNEFPQFRSLHSNRRSDFYDLQKNEIRLTGSSFDQFFDLFEGETIEYGKGSVLLAQKEPEVTIAVASDGKSAVLKIQSENGLQFFGSERNLYALGFDTLYRCGEEFRDRILPLVTAQSDLLRFSRDDLPIFCGCVLPEIRDYVTVQDPEGLLEKYLPEECTPCFYFDMEDESLFLKVKFRYGEKEYPEEKQPRETVRRDLLRERQTQSLVRFYFPGEESHVLSGEEAIFDFLTTGLDDFRQQGEVYISNRLRQKRISPSSAAVGISVTDGILTLQIDTGEFPPEELENLYQSLLQRKKYHRLNDGRYLSLDGGSHETLAEMSHILQLTPKALSKGSVQIPAFRALYLDSVLSDHEELKVTRDRQFRQMIRNFKSLSDSDYTAPGDLENILRPYQKVGFQWLKTLESCGFGGILADEMGLGKTLQVIAYLATVTKEAVGHPSLVVCPTSLILNWGEEFRKFAPTQKVSLIYGSAAERKRQMAEGVESDVWVTSYELLRQDVEEYRDLEFYACILDEGQYVKNQSTQISKAVKSIQCRQRFVLTGTPIENRLSELWNLFDFLMPGYLYSHNAFIEKLEKPIAKSKNEDAMNQLRRMVQPFLLRRMKADVLKELPPKMEHIRRIPMGQTERKTYLSAVHAAKGSLEDSGKLKILAALTRLRQVCCDPSLCFENYEGEKSKLDTCLELCSGMVANGHQILIFSQFTSMLDILRQRLDELGISNFTIEGSTTKDQRARLVKEFNAGGASVFLISLKAGGTGLNLMAADVVIHYDPWWNQAAQNQATDRAHRFGQKQCVQVYKLIAKDTIEERILDLQERKAELMDMISGDGESILQMSKDDLLALLD